VSTCNLEMNQVPLDYTSHRQFRVQTVFLHVSGWVKTSAATTRTIKSHIKLTTQARPQLKCLPFSVIYDIHK
jgi:hypothetical protein